LIPTEGKSDEELAREVVQLILAWNEANPEAATGENTPEQDED
jgi:hypothetical protein